MQVDLKGRTVTPGFNDVHQHPFPEYSWDKPYAALRLDTVTSMENLVALLKRKAAVTPHGMLITGTGYNEVKLGGQPTRAILDRVSAFHPIILIHTSFHLSAVNSMVLTMNGINRSTQDPAGGAFARSSDGTPDGIVKETARKLLVSTSMIAVPKPTPEEELEGYRRYFHNMLEGGLTSIGDCWVTPEKVRIYRSLAAERYPMRFNLYIGVDYADQLISGQIARDSSEWLRIAGIKVIHGNSLSGKTCWVSSPYEMVNPATGKEDYYGIPPARSQASLDSLVLAIHRAGLQIACHANGDREIAMLISAVEKAQAALPGKDARHRIEHCSITNKDILERIRAAGMVPVFHSYINELGPQLEVYGDERLSMMMPTRTAEDMGISYAMHSDYPVSRYEAMRRIAGAVSRISPDGKVLGPSQRITPEEAIRAYSVGGAYTTHEEGRKGRIIEGQLADLVVLDADPTRIDAAEIPSIQVVMTLVGGRIAYEKK